MNYNTVFAPTATANRFIRSHWLNLPTYALIAAIAMIAGIQSALTFIIEQLERRDEYVIICKLAKVRTQRWVVQRAITIVRFYLNARADFRTFADSTVKRRRQLSANAKMLGAKVTDFMDRVFCLG